MADLRTRWLGLNLPHPLVVGASPLCDAVDDARRLEDAGAAALVTRSLFEEDVAAASYGDVTPRLAPGEFVEHLWKLKKAVRIPVVASLNGSAIGPWLEQARNVEAAGVDALELNLYAVATDSWDPPQVIERRAAEIVRATRSLVKIPLSVKLSPFYTSLPYVAQELERAGADGLVLFNRAYPVDVDLERGTTVRVHQLSDAAELRLRLQYLSLLSGRLKGSLAVSGGVQEPLDVLKAVACGAHAVQVVSSLLRRGAGEIGRLRKGMEAWLDERGQGSIDALRGTLSRLRCTDPHAWEREQYRQTLKPVPSSQ